MFIINASLINFTTILLTFNENFGINLNNFTVKNGETTLYVNNYIINEKEIILYLKGEINIKRESLIKYEDTHVNVSYNKLFSSEEFHDKYYVDCELGASYTLDYTIFTLWAPAAAFVNLLIYENGDPVVRETPQKYKMVECNGLWRIKVRGNLKGYFYTYQLKVYNELNEVADPYAKAVGINGLRGAIIDLRDTNPKDFNTDASPSLNNFTDAVIYEASIRDISSHPDSGIRNKGRYLGLIEAQTHSSKGVSTGLQHLLDLGITHLQLMPVFDFSYESVDEKHPYKYNWGYDPQNYNVPEGSYTTDPYYPICRIYEFKRMVQQLHNNGISVVMDVVYNHIYHETENNLNKIFPGYYFRYDEEGQLSNASGCENDIATERSMVRKFIIDSVLYWASEYHIDGFRVDLMGIIDITTMNMLREALDKYNRKILLYGEGWNLNTMLPESERASMQNAEKLPEIGHFNDMLRDALRGSVFNITDRGFVSSKEGLEEVIKFCVTGCTVDYASFKRKFQSPVQSINYVSAHDDHTLWDRFELSCPEASQEELKAMCKFANGIILTSQGISFLHSGAEFCRTKGGISNSYNSTDAVNRMDWNRKFKFMDVFNYYKGLIELRKSHPAFRMTDANQIRENLVFLNTPKNTVVFILKDNANEDSWKDLLVIYNANRCSVKINIPEGNWNIVTDKTNSGTTVLNTINGSEINVDGISLYVLYRN